MVADDFITWARTPPDSVMPEISGWARGATRLRRQKGLKNKCRHRSGGLPSSDDYGLRLSRLCGGGSFYAVQDNPKTSSIFGSWILTWRAGAALILIQSHLATPVPIGGLGTILDTFSY